jgi:thiol-disulfide isomerase/thioredoxin
MKSYKYKILFLFAIIVFGFVSCSDWEQMVAIPKTRVTDSNRVVIIEEFTGTTCPNCPAGIAQSEAIYEIYPDNVIVIAVHSNFLAAPASPAKKQPDLRNPDAQAIEVFLNGALFGKPEAAINRLYDNTNNSFRYGLNEWKPLVDAELIKPLQVDLGISTNYDDATRELNVTLNITGIEAINEPIHLHCGIVESNIVADQLDAFNIIEDFVHKNVLRKMITPIPGKKIADIISPGQTISEPVNFILPIDSVLWVAENCTVFAYVSLGANKKYILQAAEAPVK